MERVRHTIDASGRVLGRLATEAAELLRGKHKVGFTFYQDHGDSVEIINADKIVVTGRKDKQKMYYRHSSYPGGLTEIPYAKMKEKHPERIIELAIKNMLPNNRLRQHWMKRLTIKGGETK